MSKPTEVITIVGGHHDGMSVEVTPGIGKLRLPVYPKRAFWRADPEGNPHPLLIIGERGFSSATYVRSHVSPRGDDWHELFRPEEMEVALWEILVRNRYGEPKKAN